MMKVIVIVIVMIMIIQKEINFTHKTICHWECPDCAVKNRQEVLKTWQKSAQIVLDFYKKRLKFKNSARKVLAVALFMIS